MPRRKGGERAIHGARLRAVGDPIPDAAGDAASGRHPRRGRAAHRESGSCGRTVPGSLAAVTDTHDHADEKETGRVEAFSDGVFAIAITLLVLDLKVPRETELHGSLAAALLRQWPIFLAYLTS